MLLTMNDAAEWVNPIPSTIQLSELNSSPVRKSGERLQMSTVPFHGSIWTEYELFIHKSEYDINEI